MGRDDQLQALLALTRELGNPTNDYAILAEGNTSTRLARNRFMVKASGLRMASITPDGFVEIRLDPLCELLADDRDIPFEDVRSRLVDARVDEHGLLSPSIETLVHAACLAVGQATYVGHTHPTAVTALLCSGQAEQLFEGTLFPDEAVVLGTQPLYVRYESPGLPLGRAVHQGLRRHVNAHGIPPKLILLGNHGIVALGGTVDEVTAVTSMAVKASRVRAAVHALGAPAPLSTDEVHNLVGRSDETARRMLLVGDESRHP